MFATDVNGLNFARTPQMNINILTIGSPVGIGGFFPKVLAWPAWRTVPCLHALSLLVGVVPMAEWPDTDDSGVCRASTGASPFMLGAAEHNASWRIETEATFLAK